MRVKRNEKEIKETGTERRTWKKGVGTLLKGSRSREKKGTFIGRCKVEEKAVETGRKKDLKKTRVHLIDRIPE